MPCTPPTPLPLEPCPDCESTNPEHECDVYKYKGFVIEPDNYGYTFAHKDWDLGDPRIGRSTGTLKDVYIEIDDILIDECCLEMGGEA